MAKLTEKDRASIIKEITPRIIHSWIITGSITWNT